MSKLKKSIDKLTRDFNPAAEVAELRYTVTVFIRSAAVLILSEEAFKKMNNDVSEYQNAVGPLTDPLIALQLFANAVAWQVGGEDGIEALSREPDSNGE